MEKILQSLLRKPQAVDTPVYEPVPIELVPQQTNIPLSARTVTIVHPELAEAYWWKSQLLKQGHRQVQTFFSTKSFTGVFEQGHQPDVVFVHDFTGKAGQSGFELARTLRLTHEYAGLIYSTADGERKMAGESLVMHGFTGHAADYIGRQTTTSSY